MEDTVSVKEFAARIKAKYPQHKDVDDSLLVDTYLKKFPVYRDNVIFDEKPKETNGSTQEPYAPTQEDINRFSVSMVSGNPPSETLSFNKQNGVDYMGLFNRKEDVDIANENGVSVSFYDTVKKSAAASEYPVEYIAEANYIKNRVEKLKKYYPESASYLDTIPIDKISPNNIKEIQKAIDQIELKFDNSFYTGLYSPIEVKSPYKKAIDEDMNYLSAIRMLEDDNKNLKYAATGENSSSVGAALAAQPQAGAGMLSWIYELGEGIAKGEVKNILKGAGKGIEKYVEGYSQLQSELHKNITINNLIKKVDSEQELTTEDKLLLKAIVDNAQLHKELDKNIPSSYKIGESIGQSAGFMGEFLISAGGTVGAGKTIIKKFAETGIKRTAIEKFGIGAVVKMAQTGIQVPLMPSLYQKTALDVSQGANFNDAFINNIWQTAAEIGSERIFISHPVKGSGAAADKLLRMAGVNFSIDKGAVGVIRNIGEEYAEEKINEILTAPKDYKSFRAFWDNFTNANNNLITFGSVALMTGGMASTVIAGDAVIKARHEARVKKYEKFLPSDLRAEIDAIVENKDLTVQQQYGLTADLISERIDRGELDDDPTKTSANAILYLKNRTQKMAADEAEKTLANAVPNGALSATVSEEGEEDSKVFVVKITDPKGKVISTKTYNNYRDADNERLDIVDQIAVKQTDENYRFIARTSEPSEQGDLEAIELAKNAKTEIDARIRKELFNSERNESEFKDYEDFFRNGELNIKYSQRGFDGQKAIDTVDKIVREEFENYAKKYQELQLQRVKSKQDDITSNIEPLQKLSDSGKISETQKKKLTDLKSELSENQKLEKELVDKSLQKTQADLKGGEQKLQPESETVPESKVLFQEVPAQPSAPKKAWEMTKEEYLKDPNAGKVEVSKGIEKKQNHDFVIRDAIRKGEVIPEEVLAQ